MPLNDEQINSIRNAISGYVFPPSAYDFIHDLPVVHQTMIDLENEICANLRSENLEQIKNGLANVVYWGWAQNHGLQRVRVQGFINGITQGMLEEFRDIVAQDRVPTMRQIYDIHMPQFSGVSFVSKILMFLAPQNYCVLDAQIAKMRNDPEHAHNVLDELTFGANETRIGVTANNHIVYNNWRQTCTRISNDYFGNRYRCVDIERGFFALIQGGTVDIARGLLNNA